MFLDDTAGDHAGQDHDEAQQYEHDAEVEGGHHGLGLVGGLPHHHRLLLQGPGAGHALSLGADDGAVPG